MPTLDTMNHQHHHDLSQHQPQEDIYTKTSPTDHDSEGSHHLGSDREHQSDRLNTFSDLDGHSSHDLGSDRDHDSDRLDTFNDHDGHSSQAFASSREHQNDCLDTYHDHFLGPGQPFHHNQQLDGDHGPDQSPLYEDKGNALAETPDSPSDYLLSQGINDQTFQDDTLVEDYLSDHNVDAAEHCTDQSPLYQDRDDVLAQTPVNSSDFILGQCNNDQIFQDDSLSEGCPSHHDLDVEHHPDQYYDYHDQRNDGDDAGEHSGYPFQQNPCTDLDRASEDAVDLGHHHPSDDREEKRHHYNHYVDTNHGQCLEDALGHGNHPNHLVDVGHDPDQSPGFEDWDDLPASTPDSAWGGEGKGEGAARGSLVLTRQQIRQHNARVGWQQWITLKGAVYHTTGFRDHFLAYNRDKAHRKTQNVDKTLGNHSREGNFDSVVEYEDRQTSDESATSVAYNDSDDEAEAQHNDSANDRDSKSESSADDALWHFDVIGTLRKSGLCMAEIEQEIAPFKIGTLNTMAVPTWKYWESIRSDVTNLCNDMVGKPSDDVGEYEREYLLLLERWLRKYRYMDPLDKQPGGDGNTNVAFMTQDPDSLREWVRTMSPVDTEVPAAGAWPSHQEDLLSPLPNTHDVFTASLRSHHSDHELSHHIEGDAAWPQLPRDVVHHDVMTEDQQAVHDARENRDCLRDPQRMERKRQRLGRYFMKKYHYSPEKMAGFLQWAAVMEHNERELIDICCSDT